MNPVGLVPVALLGVPVVLVLRAHLWRVLLYGWPASLRLRALPLELADLPRTLAVPGRELFALGFTLLGAHEESPWLGPRLRAFDFGHPDGTYATVDVHARVYFLDGDARGILLTAAFTRRTVRDPLLRAAGNGRDSIPLALERHRLRRRGILRELPSLQKRIALARTYYGPSGAMEMKRQHGISLLYVLAALLAVALTLLERG